ncbi:hypothetical protein OSTOST_03389 [Ostertagia ostertagi]
MIAQQILRSAGAVFPPEQLCNHTTPGTERLSFPGSSSTRQQYPIGSLDDTRWLTMFSLSMVHLTPTGV